VILFTCLSTFHAQRTHVPGCVRDAQTILGSIVGDIGKSQGSVLFVWTTVVDRINKIFTSSSASLSFPMTCV